MQAEDGWSRALKRGDSGQGPLALQLRVGYLKCVSPPSLASSPQGYQNHSSSPHPCLARSPSPAQRTRLLSSALQGAWLRGLYQNI